eukprot:1160124-Pelagomonas_calceolata.AAC.4
MVLALLPAPCAAHYVNRDPGARTQLGAPSGTPIPLYHSSGCDLRTLGQKRAMERDVGLCHAKFD